MRAIARTCSRLCLPVLALISCAALAGTGGKPSPGKDPQISLVTLNLYHDKAQWPKRLPMILAELKRLRPDVIALQEVLSHETLPNQAQTIADAVGYQYAFSSTDPAGSPRRYGNALLTRHRILAQDWKKLEPLDDSRTALHLRIAIGDRAVNIYSTHLHWTDQGGAIRRQQVQGLLEFIAATSDGAPSLLAGDFNAASSAPELQALAAGFVDSYGALHPNADAEPRTSSTLNLAYFAPKRIDHVFLQREAFVPLEAQIILNHADAQGHWPSDHYGVHVRMRLQPSPAPDDQARRRETLHRKTHGRVNCRTGARTQVAATIRLRPYYGSRLPQERPHESCATATRPVAAGNHAVFGVRARRRTPRDPIRCADGGAANRSAGNTTRLFARACDYADPLALW